MDPLKNSGETALKHLCN